MQRRSLDNFFLWTAALFVVIAIAAVAAIQWYSAREIDSAHRTRNEHIVETAVADYARTLAEKSFPQAYWDDAVRNLDNNFSADWAREYIGVFFWRTERIDLSATLDRGDRITFGMVGGQLVDPKVMEPLSQAIAPLVASVRKAERDRGPLPLLIDLDPAVQSGAEEPSSPLAEEVSARAEKRRRRTLPGWNNRENELRPIASSGLVRLSGDIFAVAVTLVQPDSSVLPRTDRSAIIVLAKKLDLQVIGGLGSDFRLVDARLDTGANAEMIGTAQARLVSPTGELIGSINWRSNKPGEELVRKTAPALAVFSLLLAFAAWLAMRFGRSIARDLSESEARASHMAFNDKLTGLPNRAALERAFDEMSARQRARGASFSVMCIDVDRFKSVNDSYGHQAGDTLLRQVAERIDDLCEHDHVLGRFGGDEFILLCPLADSERQAESAERIVSILGVPFDLGVGRVFVGASVGVVNVEPAEGLDAPEAFRRADLAMYRAKELGRGQYAFYDRELDDAVRARREIQEALRGALSSGGLDVHYQPKVDIEGRAIGAEALVRWPEAQARGLPTASFVRLAEETGLIEDLGAQVMRRVFEDSRRWPGLPLSVNLSAVQLRANDLNERIETLVRDTGVDARMIEFEITEGVLLDQSEETTAKLERLRALGSRISLDDFGTGYCGLSYLHLYPIDKVKIDMSFTGLLGKEPRAKALVETIVNLARSLDLDVIAEGVETEGQRQLLIEAGCRRFQGYLTGRPMPADALTEYLAARPATSQPAP